MTKRQKQRRRDAVKSGRVRFWSGVGFGVLVGILLAAWFLLPHVALAQPLDADRTAIPGGLTIQAGQNCRTPRGWEKTNTDLDSVDALTLRSKATHHPVEVGNKGKAILRSWDRSWDVAIEYQAPKGWSHDKPGKHGNKATWGTVGESLTVVVNADGFATEIALDSLALEEHKMLTADSIVFVWRLTHKGLTHGSKDGNGLRWETPDGPLQVGSALALAGESDTLRGILDTLLGSGGKLLLRELFPASALLALASGGRTVTIDPTITLQPASDAGGIADAVVNAAAGNNNFGAWTYFGGFSYGTTLLNGIMRWTVSIPIGARVTSLSLSLFHAAGLSTGSNDSIFNLFLIGAPDVDFKAGTKTGTATETGSSCWNQLAYTVQNWSADAGLANRRSFITQAHMRDRANGTGGAETVIPLPQSLLKGRVFGLLFTGSAGGASGTSYYACSSNHATATWRPKLTYTYTYDCPRGAQR